MLTACQSITDSHLLNPQDHLSASNETTDAPHSSISQLVQSIYHILNVRLCSNQQADQTTGKLDILNMLHSIKSQIQRMPHNVHTHILPTQTQSNSPAVLASLQNKCKLAEEQSKSMQMKLLNNIKRLNMQIESKNAQMAKFQLQLLQKDDEILQMGIINHNQYKKINKLETLLTEFHVLRDKQNRKEDISNENKQNMNVSSSTEVSSHSRNSSIAGCSVAETQTGDEQLPQLRPNPQIIPHKEIKYLQSIQKLAGQLGEAYSQINQLLLKLEVLDANEQKQSDDQKQPETGSSYPRETETKRPLKDKKGYFCKFWK